MKQNRRQIRKVVKRSNRLIRYLQIILLSDKDVDTQSRFFVYESTALEEYRKDIMIAHEKLLSKLS